MFSPLSPQMTAKQSYLVAYNVAAFLLWWRVAFVTICRLTSIQTVTGREEWFGEVGWVVKAAMCLALMEIVHAGLRWVKSNPVTTAVQVFSRLHVIFLIWDMLPQTRSTWRTMLVILPWTVAELIRYLFYVLQLTLSDSAMKWAGAAKWLRYSGFLVLYPLGISGEVLTMLMAIGEFGRSDYYKHWPTPMPNRLNFEVDLRSVYQLTLLAYIPGSIHMYSHMLKQRSKALAKAKAQ